VPKGFDKTRPLQCWKWGRRSPLAHPTAALSALGFVLLFWLNQGIPRAEWERLQARVFDSHEASTLECAWYPLAFLYRRATDEALYFHTAGAILGKPADATAMERGCSGCGGAFGLALPPADGRFHRPYSEVAIEYPPLVLPLIIGPRLLTDSLRTYCWIFGALMGSCLLAACTVIVHALRSLGVATKDLALRSWIAAALALAHGAISVQRLDAVTALLLAVTLSAQMQKKRDLAAVALGMAAASKFLPILLLPLIAAFDADLLYKIGSRNAPSDRAVAMRATLRFSVIACATFAVGIAPFFFFSRTALVDVLQYHGGRGLHVESFPGSLLSTWKMLQHENAPAQFNYGSFNLTGEAANSIARYTLPVAIGTTAALTGFATRMHKAWNKVPRGGAELAYGSYLALLCIFATGKVFSPQYLTWMLPMVFVLPQSHFRANAVLLGALFGISQLYFRGYFDAVYNSEPLGIATLLLRDLILIGLLVVGCILLRTTPVTPGTPVTPENRVKDGA
jgi:hypothetical protein